MVYKKNLKQLKANKPTLLVLKNADINLRKAMLKNVDNNVIKSIIEIVLNTLRGNHKLTSRTKSELEKYKKELRCISCPKRSLSSKRKVLVQKGGFLPILISSLLSGVIGKLLDHV